MNKKLVQPELAFEKIKSEELDISAPLQPYEILSYPADFTLEVLVDKWGNGELLVPPLQRRYLWGIERASKLIESFLLGLPVPPVFVYKDHEEKLLVVDGHQRIRSIVYFFSGWFGEQSDPEREPFKLVGLHPKSPFLGVDFDQLKSKERKSFNRLKDSVLRAFIMKQIQPEDDTSILAVFERLNTGGVTLQGQEIRNCIYPGKFNELLHRLNKNTNWRKIIGIEAEDKRMRDMELILRFFSLFYSSPSYEKPMKMFLNKFMRINRHASAEKLTTFQDLFDGTSEAVVKHLGAKPFHIKRGLNAAVFDSVFTVFARHLDKLRRDSVSDMKTRFTQLLSDRKYQNRVTSGTTDKEVVRDRLKQAEKALFH